MGNILSPDYTFNSIYDISSEWLKKEGIKNILLDIDNTIMPWDIHEPDQILIDWVQRVKKAGYRVVLISNAKLPRVRLFAGKLGIAGYGLAMKPLPFTFFRIFRTHRFKRSETLIVGDQILTDLVGARLSGIRVLLVDPLSEREMFVTRQFRKIEKLLGRKGKEGE